METLLLHPRFEETIKDGTQNAVLTETHPPYHRGQRVIIQCGDFSREAKVLFIQQLSTNIYGLVHIGGRQQYINHEQSQIFAKHHGYSSYEPVLLFLSNIQEGYGLAKKFFSLVFKLAEVDKKVDLSHKKITIHVDLDCKNSRPVRSFLGKFGDVEYKGESFAFSREGVFELSGCGFDVDDIYGAHYIDVGNGQREYYFFERG